MDGGRTAPPGEAAGGRLRLLRVKKGTTDLNDLARKRDAPEKGKGTWVGFPN
jgi:hypothetical protein